MPSRILGQYEGLRTSIYKQDCTMSTISAASGYVPGAGIVGKVGTFIGGIGNSILSGKAKEANNQIYNSTLHDIQLQLQIERRRAQVNENYKKSMAEAEQFLRDTMDRIYGKGAWSEYALAQERKSWVLKTFPGGAVKYVWKDSAPQFDVYVDPSGFVFDASAFAIRFYDGEGKAIPGRVTFPDRRVNTGYTGQGYGRDVIGSAWFVRQAVFTPDDSAVELSRATWSFASGAVSYAGVALDTTAQPPLYMVTLNPNGGSLGTTAYATDIAGKLNRLPEPAREGYTFQGWYTAPAGGSRVTADTAFTQDAVLPVAVCRRARAIGG